MQFFIHYFLHFIFPGIVAYFVFRKDWRRVYIVFLATMLVDADHLLANPIFDACRCSIGFHPLHSYLAIALYFGGLAFRKTRVVALGLLMHMATDSIDCWMSRMHC